MTLVAALGQQHQNCEKQRDPQHLLRLDARLASGEQQQRQHSCEQLTEKMQIGAAGTEHLSALVAVAAGRRQHKNSTASSTTDQCSSLNLSSLASSSSASSSVQHSPLMTGGGAGGVGAASNNCNSNANSNACPQRASGRNSSSSQTSSLLGASPLAPETLEGSGDDDDDEQILHEQLCDPSARALRPGSATKLFAPQHQQQCQARLSSGDLAAASNRLQAGSGVKARSLSHSNTFSPSLQAVAAATATPPAATDATATTTTTTSTLVSARLSSTASSPGDSSGRQSAASSAASAGNQQEEAEAANAQGELQARLHATAEAARPRRLSRIEHRLSLLELGYGKIESYFKLQRLGKGTYATVYMGRSRLSNDLVALKEILKEHDEGAPCTAIREVSLLRVLRHNNIVTLHDICHTPRKLTLVFEYVGPDLYAYMKENNNLLSIHNVRLLLYQLLRGIAFCHSRQVLHRDLKPQNLLINARGELKICDFGLARAKSIPTKSYSNEVVTLWYRPPDVLLGNTDYDHSIDMWGVGCIFYEMASGRTFFPGSSVRQQLYLIFSSLGAPSRHNWPEILQNPEYQAYSFPSFRPEKLAHRVPRLDSAGILLLMSFLRFKPSERISADEARRDPFFAALPERVHKLSERESIFDVPGVYMTLNPGQKMGHHI